MREPNPAEQALARALRKHAGLSQAQVAALCGLTQSDVSRAERGRNPRWRTIERLFLVYGCRAVVIPYRGYPIMTARQAFGPAVAEDLKRSWDAKLRAKGFFSQGGDLSSH